MRKSLSSSRGHAVLAVAAASLAALISLAAFGSSDVRSGDRLSFALTGARVIAAPGRVFDRGVVVVRGGVVEAVGAEGKAGVPRHDLDPRLEAMLPAIEGKIPVLVVADRLAQIRAALSWAKSENLKVVISGGRDAWRAASDLAAAGVPVILDPVIGLPTRADEPYDAPYAAPGVLSKAGVHVGINEGDSQFVRNLAHHASVAVAYGLPREKALAAITLEPARILGIADRVGSLEPGKDATLFVSDRDVLDFRYTVVAAYVDGRPLDLSDKHKRLYERYKNRPKPGGAR